MMAGLVVLAVFLIGFATRLVLHVVTLSCLRSVGFRLLRVISFSPLLFFVKLSFLSILILVL